VLSFDLEFTRDAFALSARDVLESGAIGICGPSGSGKTTLLALLAGLIRPARGTIVFGDEALVDTTSGVFTPAWRRHFALVFQDGQLFPHLSARDNLLYGYRRCDPVQRRFHLDEIVDLLEIGALVERRPSQLSGGERQRVALGRALLCSPRVLLLDEPLASLDDRLKQQILPFLLRVRNETGIPMLYVSHSRAEVEFLADRILRMERGRLEPDSGRADDHR
jgi:molybdate transport system ATP-binding protein